MQTKPRDGKLLAIGHSMGGILLYALLSRYGKVALVIFILQKDVGAYLS